MKRVEDEKRIILRKDIYLLQEMNGDNESYFFGTVKDSSGKLSEGKIISTGFNLL